jgi:hypothetical protein
MEQIIFAKLPNLGRLCGYCYAHLGPDDARCAVCGWAVADFGTVSAVPRQVLRAYFAKRRREAWMVNSFAYIGMFVGVAASFGIVLMTDGWWRLTALFTLTIGSWWMANLLGGLFGGNFGYNWGRRVRNRMWAEWVRQREDERAGATTRDLAATASK